MNDRDFFLRSRNDPRFWNRVVYGDFERPWGRQWEIWESVAKYRKTTVRAGHGVGKSHIAGRIVPWFLTNFRPAVVFTTAPTSRQVERVLWGEIRRQWKAAKIDLGGRVYDGKPQIIIDDDWYALGFTTRKRAATEDLGSLFQGFHALHVLFIIDEAAACDREVWDAAEAVCTTEHSRILAIGNPTDANSEFARTFKTPGPDSPGGWNKIKISVLDSPNFTQGRIVIPKLTSPVWVEDKKISWGESSPMFLCKVLAEFPEMGTDTLIPLPFIERALERYRTWKTGTEEERTAIEALAPDDGRHLGVDCAREGDDMTVGYSIEGAIAERVLRLPKSKVDETVGAIGRMNSDIGFKDITVEQDPTGAAVLDFLRAHGHREIYGELPGGTPHDKSKFFNRKAELAFKLRERFVDAENIALDNEDAGAQLSQYKFKLTTHAGYEVFRLEPKAEMKKRIGRSPDDGDALFYANARVGATEGRADSTPSAVANENW